MRLAPSLHSLLLSASVTREFLQLDARALPLLGKDPPKEVCLLKVGLNQTLYGDLWLTNEGMKEALEIETVLGRDLCWDWNHFSEPNGPKMPEGLTAEQQAEWQKKAGIAAAWFSLEARYNDGIYAVAPKRMKAVYSEIDGIFWTEDGHSQIKKFERRHFSPGVLWVEGAGGRKEVCAITSCALTNSPATINQRPLLMSAAQPQGSFMNWEQYLAQLKANGATQEEITRAKALFDANQHAELLTLSCNIATARGEQLLTARRNQILLQYERKYPPAERASLEKIKDLDWLEENLKGRDDHPLRAQALVLAQSPQSPITGGETPVSHDGRPWEQTNYRERHKILLSDPDKYRQMRESAQARGIVLGRVQSEHLGRPVRDMRRVLLAAEDKRIFEKLRAQRMMLATGLTQSSDIIEVVPEILNDAIEAGFAGMRVFQGSPVVIMKLTLPNFDANRRPIKGGSKIQVPYWKPIGEFQKVTNEASQPTDIQKLESEEEEAVVEHWKALVQLTYEAQAFAQEGSDPYNESERQLLEQGSQAIEAGLIVEARTATLELDITGTGTGLLTYDAWVKALEKWGDEEFEKGMKSGARIFMHSNGLRQVRTIKDGMGMPIFLDAKDGGPPIVMGMQSEISDLMELNEDDNHELVIAKAGAMAAWVNGSKFKVQTFHDVNDDTDLNAVHLYYAPHLYLRPPKRTKQAAVKVIYKAAA